MMSKVLISRLIRLCLSLMLIVTIGLKGNTQTPEDITIKVRQFDNMAQDIMIGEKLNAISQNYIDTLKFLYNELAKKFTESQVNLKRAMDERDTAYVTIMSLREQVRSEQLNTSRAMDKYYKAWNKGHKQIGLDLHPLGYNFFTKQFYFGAGLSIRIAGINLFPKDKNEYQQGAAGSYKTNVFQLIR